MTEKLEFSARLKAAMQAAGLEPRPSVLVDVFNTRYWGRPVTFQTASSWLRGQAIPQQDKLQVLAEALNMEPHVLRFGAAVPESVLARRQRWEEGVGYLERETFDAFLRLAPAQRKIVREVILAFNAAYPSPDEAAPTDGGKKR